MDVAKARKLLELDSDFSPAQVLRSFAKHVQNPDLHSKDKKNLILARNLLVPLESVKRDLGQNEDISPRRAGEARPRSPSGTGALRPPDVCPDEDFGFERESREQRQIRKKRKSSSEKLRRQPKGKRSKKEASAEEPAEKHTPDSKTKLRSFPKEEKRGNQLRYIVIKNYVMTGDPYISNRDVHDAFMDEVGYDYLGVNHNKTAADLEIQEFLTRGNGGLTLTKKGLEESLAECTK